MSYVQVYSQGSIWFVTCQHYFFFFKLLIIMIIWCSFIVFRERSVPGNSWADVCITIEHYYYSSLFDLPCTDPDLNIYAFSRTFAPRSSRPINSTFVILFISLIKMTLLLFLLSLYYCSGSSCVSSVVVKQINASNFTTAAAQPCTDSKRLIGRNITPERRQELGSLFLNIGFSQHEWNELSDRCTTPCIGYRV